MAPHFHFSVIEVGRAGFILGIFLGLAELPVQDGEPLRSDYRPRLVIIACGPDRAFNPLRCHYAAFFDTIR